jgi:hypothetical protein
MPPKTNDERVKELDFVHTEWGDTLHVADVLTLLTEKDKQKDEAVAEAIENLKRVKQPDNGLPLFFIFQDILSYAPDGEIATLAKQGLEALKPPTN